MLLMKLSKIIAVLTLQLSNRWLVSLQAGAPEHSIRLVGYYHRLVLLKPSLQDRV